MLTPLRGRLQAASSVELVWVAIATVLLVVAAVSAVWFRWHPDRSFDAGYGIGVEGQVGRTVWTLLEHGDNRSPGVVKIMELAPRISNDGAAVEVEYLVCELDDRVLAANGVDGFGYGQSDADVSKYCRRTWPAVGGEISLGIEARQDLIVGVTPTQPGRTVVDHHVIRFEEGWQRGEDHIHVTVDLAASS